MMGEKATVTTLPDGAVAVYADFAELGAEGTTSGGYCSGEPVGYYYTYAMTTTTTTTMGNNHDGSPERYVYACVPYAQQHDCDQQQPSPPPQYYYDPHGVPYYTGVPTMHVLPQSPHHQRQEQHRPQHPQSYHGGGPGSMTPAMEPSYALADATTTCMGTTTMARATDTMAGPYHHNAPQLPPTPDPSAASLIPMTHHPLTPHLAATPPVCTSISATTTPALPPAICYQPQHHSHPQSHSHPHPQHHHPYPTMLYPPSPNMYRQPPAPPPHPPPTCTPDTHPFPTPFNPVAEPVVGLKSSPAQSKPSTEKASQRPAKRAKKHHHRHPNPIPPSTSLPHNGPHQYYRRYTQQSRSHSNHMTRTPPPSTDARPEHPQHSHPLPPKKHSSQCHKPQLAPGKKRRRLRDMLLFADPSVHEHLMQCLVGQGPHNTTNNTATDDAHPNAKSAGSPEQIAAMAAAAVSSGRVGPVYKWDVARGKEHSQYLGGLAQQAGGQASQDRTHARARDTPQLAPSVSLRGPAPSPHTSSPHSHSHTPLNDIHTRGNKTSSSSPAPPRTSPQQQGSSQTQPVPAKPSTPPAPSQPDTNYGPHLPS